MTDPVAYREATIREVWPFFQRVTSEVWGGFRHDLLSSGRLSECDAAYVAEINGAICGAITLDFDTELGPELAQAYVMQPREGGIGRTLATLAVERLCTERPGRLIYCNVITEAMDRTLNSLPPELRRWLKPNRTYQILGDELFPEGEPDSSPLGPKTA